MNTKNHKEKHDSIWNSVAFIVISLLSLLNFTLNVKTYGLSLFGVFILISSLFSLGSSLDFGFGVSTVKIISESKIENLKNINEIFSSFFSAYLGLAFLIFSGYEIYFLFFFKSTLPAEIINFDLNYSLFFHLLNISFLLRYLTNFLNKVFEGLKEYIYLSKVNIAFNIIYTICIVSNYYLKVDLINFVIFMVVANAVLFLILIISLTFKYKIFVHIKFINYKIIKSNLTYNLNLQFSFFINSFIDPIIKFIIAHFLSLNFVTYFETSKKIIDLSNGLIFSAQKNLLNNLSEAKYLNKLKEYINNNIYKYARLSNNYSLVIYGIANPFIFTFMYFWFNPESALMYLMFTLSYALINFGGCKYLVLMIDSNGKYLVLMQGISLVTISLFVYMGLAFFKSYYGLLCFFIPTLISIILILSIMKKRYGLDVGRYFQKTDFKKILLLNSVVLLEIFILLVFPEYTFYILGAVFLILLIMFFKSLQEPLLLLKSFINAKNINSNPEL